MTANAYRTRDFQQPFAEIGLLPEGAYVCVGHNRCHYFAKSGGPCSMSNVVNFDLNRRLHQQQIDQRRKVAEMAVDNTKAQLRRLASLEQNRRT